MYTTTAPTDEDRRIAAKKLLKYVTISDRLEGVSLNDRLQGVRPEDMVKRLDAEEIATMQRLLSEQKLWLELEAAVTAVERITLIETMEETFRPTFLAEENREQLLDGLDDGEQATLDAWLVDHQ